MPDDKVEAKGQLVMLNCLLLSRTHEGSAQAAATQPAAGRPTDAPNALAADPAACKGGPPDNRFDEEVEAYLASLRKAVSDPDHLENLTPYLFEYDIEALQRLAHSDDGAVRYLVCKAKDDVLILAAAAFDAAGEAALPVGLPFSHGSQGQMGRGPAYFHFAFSFTKKLADPAEATAIVEKNLPPGLWKYSTILAYVTDQQFDFTDRFAGSEVYHLMRTVEKTGKRIRLERKRNEFLDAYLEWRGSGTEEAKQRVLEIAGQLRRLDPGFSYTPTEK